MVWLYEPLLQCKQTSVPNLFTHAVPVSRNEAQNAWNILSCTELWLWGPAVGWARRNCVLWSGRLAANLWPRRIRTYADHGPVPTGSPFLRQKQRYQRGWRTVCVYQGHHYSSSFPSLRMVLVLPKLDCGALWDTVLWNGSGRHVPASWPPGC